MKKVWTRKVRFLAFVFALHSFPSSGWVQDLVVKIVPDEIGVKLEDTVDVNIKIENGQNLGAFQFDLLYDSHIVHSDTARLGAFLGSTGRAVVPVKPIIDNVNNPGKITFAGFSLGIASGPSGSDILATVTLIVQGLGDTVLKLENIQITNTMGFTQPVVTVHNGVIIVSDSISTGVTQSTSIPDDFELFQNYPNPFNPETLIRFQLSQTRHVLLKIFNTLGQEIRTLADVRYEAGYHSVKWDGKDNNGNPASSGIYFYQLQAGRFSQVKKMMLLR